MLAVCESQPNSSSQANQQAFLKMLPTICRAVRISFGKIGAEALDELTSEVVAGAYVLFTSLAKRGRLDLALPTPLAKYAIAQVRTGRRVGNRLRIGDVMSPYAQFQKGFDVERLDSYDDQDGCWREVLLEDKRATPAEVAICRIDFAAWLRTLKAKIRKVALALARGETTQAVAKMFHLSPARISQIRQWLKKSWEAFHGESIAASASAA
jgi:hypothetical protein